MGKVYIEVQYRIKNTVFNSGYIRIDGDTIHCLFSLDYSYIKIIDGRIHFYLEDYEPENDSYNKTEEFIGTYNYIDTLECPYSYILKNDSGIILSLKLIKKVYDPCLSRDIEESFQYRFGK